MSNQDWPDAPRNPTEMWEDPANASPANVDEATEPEAAEVAVDPVTGADMPDRASAGYVPVLVRLVATADTPYQRVASYGSPDVGCSTASTRHGFDRDSVLRDCRTCR